MPFQSEQGVTAIIDAITSTPDFADGKASEDLQLWDTMPPAFLGVREGWASLVIPPIAIPIGQLADLKNEDGDVTPKGRVRIRRLVNDLQTYREETIVESGQVNHEAVERCGGVKEPFFMICSDEEGTKPMGLVMIHGTVPGGDDGPLLRYRFKQGYIWLESFIKLNTIPESGSIKLVRAPELVTDD